jgi:hypothetical protein
MSRDGEWGRGGGVMRGGSYGRQIGVKKGIKGEEEKCEVHVSIWSFIAEMTSKMAAKIR